MRFRSPLVALPLLVAMVVVAAACGDGEGLASTSAGADADVSDGDADGAASATSEALTASTVRSPDSSEVDSSATVATTATSATTTVGSGADASSSTEPAQSTSTEPFGLVFEPGEFGAFASPSGNILCVMQQLQASCWITEKQWTIEQPSDPFCEESDWGDAIDVTTTEVVWPCYTDFIYDPDAAALAYGDAMVVGRFRCDSASTGVTCRNQSGQGFTLAKADVQIF